MVLHMTKLIQSIQMQIIDTTCCKQNIWKLTCHPSKF